MGGGGAQTTNDITSMTKSLMNVDNSIRQNIQEDCISQDSQKNIINIINTKVKGATFAQKNQLENLCSLQSVFKTNVKSDVQNKIADAIAQAAKSEGGSPFGGSAATKNIAKITKENKTNINNSQVLNAVKRCIMNIDQSNIINLINSDVDGGDFNQVNTAFKKCLMSFEATSEIAQEATNENKTDVTQKGEAKGGDPFASSAIGGIVSIIIVCSLISILVPIIFPSGENKPSTASPTASPTTGPSAGPTTGPSSGNQGTYFNRKAAENIINQIYKTTNKLPK